MSSEKTEILMENDNVRIERITSAGHSSPEGFWYDQSEDEWVALLIGHAVIGYSDGTEKVLGAGDTLFIPAGRKHRVSYTSSDPECVWFCVFAKKAKNNE
ncbi:MAG: cupin domain-containing protein [Eubacteriales bacterium]|nr:cupin domain-containing protein [Eubacteriales bacterium]